MLRLSKTTKTEDADRLIETLTVSSKRLMRMKFLIGVTLKAKRTQISWFSTRLVNLLGVIDRLCMLLPTGIKKSLLFSNRSRLLLFGLTLTPISAFISCWIESYLKLRLSIMMSKLKMISYLKI